MARFGTSFLKTAPFLQLLPALVAGILCRFYLPVDARLVVLITVSGLTCVVSNTLLSLQSRFHTRWMGGVGLTLLLFAAGIILCHQQHVQYKANWIGHYDRHKTPVSMQLLATPVEKGRHHKALAKVEAMQLHSENQEKWFTASGYVWVYFQQSGNINLPVTNARILVRKSLQPIANSGNPGAFDYKRYCAMRGIHYQVFLKEGDYRLIDHRQQNWFRALLNNTGNHVRTTLDTYIQSKKEAGIAAALLIGYKDNLDAELLQAYSNTGVIHIIAISGLHLGMIYGLLLLLFKPFRKPGWLKWIKLSVILAVLWGFTLLAGAGPSILRAAVMFSFIAVGENVGRRTNMYNTLAASAFCLLVYNPYYLWDIGFQLSYAAVLSIALFMKPLYRSIYISNKLLNFTWQLNAVTISAQILTLPLLLYHFHQFPNLFLLANFFAVPLSAIILYGCLLLLVLAPLPLIGTFTGQLICLLINRMNSWVEQMNTLSFAVTDQVQINLVQVCLLYMATALLARWLMHKQPAAFAAGCAVLFFFLCIRCTKLAARNRQQRLIVYHVPRRSAIDLIAGRHYRFWGDRILHGNNALRRFYLNPARSLYQVTAAKQLPGIHPNISFIGQQSVLWINRNIPLEYSGRKIPVDIIIISGNPRLSLARLAAVFECRRYVFDSSNPLWKIRHWKKEADSLHLRHHSVPGQGAFEMAQ